ncbi:hypothetical protein X738_30535 [Mesorhizobium sp. LNHC209A00]|nr:hypothetical protein X738_30535 [Mesorhizobium sp. LNHC209A00]
MQNFGSRLQILSISWFQARRAVDLISPGTVAVCSLAPLAYGVDGTICSGRQCRSVPGLFRLYWPGPRQPSPFIMASNAWMAGIQSIDFTYAAEAQ